MKKVTVKIPNANNRKRKFKGIAYGGYAIIKRGQGYQVRHRKTGKLLSTGGDFATLDEAKVFVGYTLQGYGYAADYLARDRSLEIEHAVMLSQLEEGE